MARAVDEIQADLTAAYAARRAALQAQSYSVDSGQGRSSVNRAELEKIQKVVKALEFELEEATGGGSLYMELCR